jgi:hypothetical protein
MQLPRRQVLTGLAGLGVGAVMGMELYSLLTSPHRNKLTSPVGSLVGGVFKLDGLGHKTQGTDFDVVTSARRAFRLDLLDGRYQEIPVQCPLHVLEPHPQESHIMVGCSRRGRWMSMVDWQVGREVRSLQLPEGRMWYGHVAFTPNGQHVLAPISNHYGEPGQEHPLNAVAVVDLETMKIVDEIPTLNGRMHDLTWVEGSRFVSLAAPLSRSPTLLMLDLNSREKPQEVRQLKLPDLGFQVGSNPGHLRLIGNHLYFAISSHDDPTRGADGLWMGYDLVTQTPLHADGAKHLKNCGELLSLDVDERRQRIWITAPNLRELKVFDLQTRDPVGAFQLADWPQSVRLLPEAGLAIVGTRQRVYVYDAETLIRRRELESPWAGWQPEAFYHSHTRIV